MRLILVILCLCCIGLVELDACGGGKERRMGRREARRGGGSYGMMSSGYGSMSHSMSIQRSFQSAPPPVILVPMPRQPIAEPVPDAPFFIAAVTINNNLIE